MRSLATRESDKALSEYVQDAIDICKAEGFDLIILESAGLDKVMLLSLIIATYPYT
jgi:methylmalonyl-CoA mutase